MPADGQKNVREDAIDSEAEVRAVVAEIVTLMVELRRAVGREIALVCSGRLVTAAQVARRKIDLAGAFVANVARARASRCYLEREAPELLDVLLRQHAQFRARLRLDLARLATARAVSDGILRSLSNELHRRETAHASGAEEFASRKAA
jgi:cytidylate kinase